MPGKRKSPSAQSSSESEHSKRVEPSEAIVLVYARTAPEEQGEADQGLLEQIESCAEYLRTHGYTDTNAHVVADEGYLGLEANGPFELKQNYGPGVKTLVGAILNRQINAVIFTAHDRISSDPDLYGHFHAQCRFSKVEVISLDDEASGTPYVNIHWKRFIHALARDHTAGLLDGPLEDFANKMLARALEQEQGSPTRR